MNLRGPHFPASAPKFPEEAAPPPSPSASIKCRAMNMGLARAGALTPLHSLRTRNLRVNS
jgi:hypothetical protein